MALASPTPTRSLRPLERGTIELRLKGCPRLPSLGRINDALRDLLNADQRYTSQISEIIRRDPSLTARLLRLVNSVYFGLTTPVNSIEEAIFYLGIRQIRQLSMATPIIEDFQKLAGDTPFPWREFWQHCIGTAILTREVISGVQVPVDETDYVAGLVHDVGMIIMAAGFPEHFVEIHHRSSEGGRSLNEIENEVLGISHDELGALYLRNHGLPTLMIEASQFHHCPERAEEHAPIVAAVQIADLLLRHAKIGYSGTGQEVQAGEWEQTAGWQILFANQDEAELALTRASLKRALDRLPTILEGLV